MLFRERTSLIISRFSFCYLSHFVLVTVIISFLIPSVLVIIGYRYLVIWLKIPILYTLCPQQVSDQLIDQLTMCVILFSRRFHCSLCVHCVIIFSAIQSL